MEKTLILLLLLLVLLLFRLTSFFPAPASSNFLLIETSDADVDTADKNDGQDYANADTGADPGKNCTDADADAYRNCVKNAKNPEFNGCKLPCLTPLVVNQQMIDDVLRTHPAKKA